MYSLQPILPLSITCMSQRFELTTAFCTAWYKIVMIKLSCGVSWNIPVVKEILHRNLPKYCDLSYKRTRCRHKYFRFIIPLELQPYLFSQCFLNFFWLKFLKYPKHKLRTPIFWLQSTESALHFENLENRLVL